MKSSSIAWQVHGKKELRALKMVLALMSALMIGGMVFLQDQAYGFWVEKTGDLKEDPNLALINQSLIKLAKELRPAVVQIGAPQPQAPPAREVPPDRPPQPDERPRSGSGFIISPDGYIVTNNHVIGDSRDVKVELLDDRSFKAKVIGKDSKTDLALLKVEAEGNLPVIPLGDSDQLEIGSFVIAVGNPFGLEFSVTLGVVSGKGRNFRGLSPFEDFIQTDASINPGNSGGPLVNIRGEVIGVNTAIIPNSRVGFAIPINFVKTLLPTLKEKGEIAWGWLGVSIQNISDDLAKALDLEKAKGALLTQIMPGQPASKAGFKRGDVILNFDEKPIETARDLQKTVATTPVGKEVQVKIFREGKLETLSVVVGKTPEFTRVASETPKKKDFGFTVDELNAEKAQKFGIKEQEGIFISEVAPEGPGAAAGIRAGDFLVEVNRKEVKSISDYQQAIQKRGEVDLFDVKRGDSIFYFAVKPKLVG
ncbi:MAG: Do family serine endopeptidase [Candidatus Tectomicrobia bacterium]|nr:Do family serine endopeptidase [Candidatus Tectomicrobia bacterium]